MSFTVQCIVGSVQRVPWLAKLTFSKRDLIYKVKEYCFKIQLSNYNFIICYAIKIYV